MCARSPHSMSEWPMGALPPVKVLRVTRLQLFAPFSPGFRFQGAESEVEVVGLSSLRVGRHAVPRFVCRVGTRMVAAHLGHLLRYVNRNLRLAQLTLLARPFSCQQRDPNGFDDRPVHFRVDVKGGRLVASQAVESSGQFNHFLDGLRWDVTPYVHAAVARLVGHLFGLTPAPLTDDRSACSACAAFRTLRGADYELGDAVAQYPSRNTATQRLEGPWTHDQYLCACTWETPPDVFRLVDAANALARRGYPTPVLRLDQAGEGCPNFVPRDAKPWDTHAAAVDAPQELTARDGKRVLSVSAPSWDIQLGLE